MTDNDVMTRPDDLIDRHEAAAIAGVTLRTIARWARSGDLPVYRDNLTGNPYYSRGELVTLLECPGLRPGAWVGNRQRAD